MARHARPEASDLSITKTARFLHLPKALTKASVRKLFDGVIDKTPGASRIAEELRVKVGSASDHYVYSFIFFRCTTPVPFLITATFEEVRYGFVLLIERDGHLAVFQKGAKGLDEAVTKLGLRIPNQKLTHLFASDARYQRLSMQRMSMARHELRGASFDADDLSTALGPSSISRGVLRSVRMTTTAHGTVGVTPRTGRIRVSAPATDLTGLIAYVDDVIVGVSTESASAFLDVFAVPVTLDDLPDDVLPTGLLIDQTALLDALEDLDDPHELVGLDEDALNQLFGSLSEVLTLLDNEEKWEAIDSAGTVVAQLTRLKNSYGIRFNLSNDYLIATSDGEQETLSRWFRKNLAFCISFSSPEYFYAVGQLYRRPGFEKEVAQVRRFLSVHAPLDIVSSEKGGPYDDVATNFAADSMFGIVENSLAQQDTHLWCGDLGDEWADYMGVDGDRITFYHCKHGEPTTGAAAFQIVVSQALKNLSRIKLLPDHAREKIAFARQRSLWGNTNIPLLVRGGTWDEVEQKLIDVIGDPTATWRVALVVTALSLSDFNEAAADPKPKPYFIQLVRLLSSFISECRARDAQPLIYCRS